MHDMMNHDDDHDYLEKRSLFEVTSSGLTHSCTGPFYGKLCQPILNTHSLHRYSPSNNNITNEKKNQQTTATNYYYTDRNFGSIHFFQKFTFEVQVHDVDGNIVLRTGLRSIHEKVNLTEEEIQRVVMSSCSNGHLQRPFFSVVILFLLLFYFQHYYFRKQTKNNDISTKRKQF